MVTREHFLQFLFFTPLGCPVGQCSGLRRLAGEFIESDALPDDTGNRETEPFAVIELPIIISVCLLVKVTE
jgi:hypothetical protein